MHILIAESSAERRDQLRAALALDPEMEVVGAARDGLEAVRLSHALRPEIVLVASDLPPRDGFTTSEMLASSGLPLEIMLLTDSVLPIDWRRAMRAGAKDVVCYASEPAILCAAIRTVYDDGLRRRSPEFTAKSAPEEGGRVIAVCGAKGGIGKTTLAVNLAVALALDTGQPNVLVDLYTQFADAALLLNLFPRRTLADLVKLDSPDLDGRALEDHLERHACGLRLLAGSSLPLPLESLTPMRLDEVLSLLRSEYKFIVLDVPPVLHDTTRRALSQADTVLLVANLFDLTTLADTRFWLDALSGPCVAPESIQIVLNRVSPANRLQIGDISRTLARPVQHQIPNDGKLVPASVNTGVPFVLSHPSSRVACSVFGLARSLHGAAQ